MAAIRLFIITAFPAFSHYRQGETAERVTRETIMGEQEPLKADGVISDFTIKEHCGPPDT